MWLVCLQGEIDSRSTESPMRLKNPGDESHKGNVETTCEMELWIASYSNMFSWRNRLTVFRVSHRPHEEWRKPFLLGRQMWTITPGEYSLTLVLLCHRKQTETCIPSSCHPLCLLVSKFSPFLPCDSEERFKYAVWVLLFPNFPWLLLRTLTLSGVPQTWTFCS